MNKTNIIDNFEAFEEIVESEECEELSSQINDGTIKSEE